MQICAGRPSTRKASIALASSLIAAVSLAWSAPSPAAEPKIGRYAGIGEDGARIGFEVTKPDFAQVEGLTGVLFYGCSSTIGTGSASAVVDQQGRYRLDVAGANSEISFRGRFPSSKRAKGRLLYEQMNPMFCPGSYEYEYAATRMASIPTKGGGTGKPLNGRYAGGGGDVYVWLNVVQGVVEDVRIDGDFGNCGTNLQLGDDDGPPDPGGAFSLQYTVPPVDVFFRGRFKSKTTVKGKLVWATTGACPVDTVEVAYRAKRLKLNN